MNTKITIKIIDKIIKFFESTILEEHQKLIIIQTGGSSAKNIEALINAISIR